MNIYTSKIAPLDLELLISAAIKKPREFVLANPDHKLTKKQELQTKNLIARRRRGEPIAYILGQKEFFGLNFKVNENVLIPRPETELLVERAIRELTTDNQPPTTILDVGTGSGNIIISIANELKKSKLQITNYKLLAIDISAKALEVARQNAKLHKFDKEIKFLKGDLLEQILKLKKSKLKNRKIIIIANLPYLSKIIYSSVSRDIKKYEPKSALLSGNGGLSHYEKLLKQIGILKQRNSLLPVSCFLEISPEQKRVLQKLIYHFFPKAKATFHKDLSSRWRVCQIDLP